MIEMIKSIIVKATAISLYFLVFPLALVIMPILTTIGLTVVLVVLINETLNMEVL